MKKLDKTIEDRLKEVVNLSFQREVQKIEEQKVKDIKVQPLSSLQIKRLAKKIKVLPLQYQGMLFFRYCFHNTTTEIEEMLMIENVDDKLKYVKKTMAELIGHTDMWIDEESMERVCKLALKESVKEYNTVESSKNPQYSNNFRKRLKNKGIRIKRSPTQMALFISKRVAIFILISILSFSAFLAVNVEARTKLTQWIVETFPEFTKFQSQNIEDEDGSDSIELPSIYIDYIPEGFSLENKDGNDFILVYEYANDSGQRITIMFLESSDAVSDYNTEGAEIEEFTFKDSQAYIWEAAGITTLIWHQDGIECHVSGDINRETIIKIGENIKK